MTALMNALLFFASGFPSHSILNTHLQYEEEAVQPSFSYLFIRKEISVYNAYIEIHKPSCAVCHTVQLFLQSAELVILKWCSSLSLPSH